MREIPRDGNNHAFLIKALREAGNELEEEFYGVRPHQLDQHYEDIWSLRRIAGHLKDNEELTLAYLEAIASGATPTLEVVDLEARAQDGEYEGVDLDDLLYGFAGLRQHVLYLLHGLAPDEWQRGGTHPYRGIITVAALVRELNEHDLNHLWQILRIKESMR